MMRLGSLLAGLSLSLCFAAPVVAQAPAPRPAAPAVQAATPDEPVPRAARAKARQECRDEHIALSGNDLRAAMRECIQARFPGVQLYARDGVTRDGKPTATAVRAACKSEVDERRLEGSARTAALTACFAAKRPDLAQRAECRKEARDKGLDGDELRKAVGACGREARS
jgi:pyruvate/2-oxoglutarate dehydrogenase complex dihydrolipoamide acyltransferase (E2) component